MLLQVLHFVLYCLLIFFLKDVIRQSPQTVIIVVIVIINIFFSVYSKHFPEAGCRWPQLTQHPVKRASAREFVLCARQSQEDLFAFSGSWSPSGGKGYIRILNNSRLNLAATYSKVNCRSPATRNRKMTEDRNAIFCHPKKLVTTAVNLGRKILKMLGKWYEECSFKIKKKTTTIKWKVNSL